MKILLIEPNINLYALMPTMSLTYLKGFIKEKTKHDAKIIDLVFHKKDWKRHLIEEIRKEKPDLIGLSVLSFNYLESLKIARFIKNNFDIKIIFGGVHVILSPENVIQNNEVDIVCTGEGEGVLEELLDNDLNCTGVRGIWYKAGGQIIKNKNRRLIENLDNLAFPDFNDFDLEKYFAINHNHLPITASRGCPYACSYCSNHALKKKLEGKYVRFRSVDNIIQEIELRIKQYHKEGFKYLYFFDDTFILDRDFVLEFCKKFKRRGLNKLIKWNVNVRADLVTDEIIKSMKDAGCYEARMGIEAGSDYIRNKVYNKNITKEQIFNAFGTIKKHGLQLRLYFIVGAPYETMGMMEESLEVAKQSLADDAFFTPLYPLPGTEIKKTCEKENIIEKSNERKQHDAIINPVARTNFVSSTQLQKFNQKIKRRQTGKYFQEGIKSNTIFFIWDVLLFLLYFKRKYDLEQNQLFRWSVQKYRLK